MAHKEEDYGFSFWLREKVIPPLIVATCIGLFATYLQIVRLVDAHDVTRSEVSALKVQVNTMQEQYVKRTELLEVMKRVEQQLEIVLLKAKSKDNGKQ